MVLCTLIKIKIAGIAYRLYKNLGTVMIEFYNPARIMDLMCTYVYFVLST
jgi:hypothetical protein